jgi:hypothetical protein
LGGTASYYVAETGAYNILTISLRTNSSYIYNNHKQALAKRNLASQKEKKTVKLKLHQHKLKKDKLTTHDIWSNQQTLEENKGRKKSDEHADARDGDGATPTSSVTYNKTSRPTAASYATHRSTTTPEERPQVASS